MALNEKQVNDGMEGSSSSPMTNRALYKDLWKADVPPKVHVFTWKLASDGLATQDKRRRSGLVSSSVCDVCGTVAETGHHAVVMCTKAAALWREMRGVWHLSDRQQIHETGPNWLLILLSTLDREQKARVLLLMWRGWFLCNDVIFGKGRETLTGSVKFLVCYSDTLSELSKQGKRGINEKGITPMHSLHNEALKRGCKWRSVDLRQSGLLR
jgi:hypothetical protein